MRDRTDRKVRNAEIANDRVSGMTYQQIGDKHNLSAMQVGRILKDDEIKEIVHEITSGMIALLPKAYDVHRRVMEESKDEKLALRAAETVLKVGSVIPSNVVNQRITNIVNQQNNLITPETMELVKKLLPGLRDKDKSIDKPKTE